MAKTLHLTFGVILFLSFFRTTRTFSGHDDRAPWYIGCYNNSEIREDASSKPVYQDDQMTPVFCVRQCALNESFRYAAVRNGSICICLTQIQRNNSTNHTFCNVSCHGDKNIVCGGTKASSVYSTAVPLLVLLRINLPQQVRTNTLITADSELSIKRPADEVSNLDSIKQGNQTAGIILMKWYSGDKLWNKTQYTLQANQTTSSVLLFATPGHHTVCVEAFNLFSHQRKCTFVDVVAPINGLKLVTVFQGGKLLSVSSPLLVTSYSAVFFKYLTESGSRPKFRFDFGDGSPPLTVMDTSSDRYSSVCSCVTVSHVFERCGNFTVNATASNAVSLESVAQPGHVYVGVSIATVEIEKNTRNFMYVEANVSSSLKAVVKQVPGCAVLFQWNFNDSSPDVITTVPSVSHTFSSLQSVYHVTVVAFNDHSRKKTIQQVRLQERLQGVILKPEVPHMILGIEEPTTVTIQLTLPFTGLGRVIYKLYRSNMDPATGSRIPIKFRKLGRYVLYAEAANQVSKVYSNKIVVSVLEKITELSIHHDDDKGTILLGEPVHLSARIKQGTGNITFHWDFGEGLPSSPFNTTSPNVTYKFTKIGKYKITVIATNGLKDGEVEASIAGYMYVSNVPHCYPPGVTILGVDTNRVNRYKEIRLEADVTLNCSETRELLYLWKILSKPVHVKPAGVSLTEQFLIIPPYTLDYGKYTFQLEVKVKGTGLSGEYTIILDVVPGPLVAVIDGGTTKVVSHQIKKLTLDASSSHDPDFPDKQHMIGFYWSCSPLGNVNISCFNESRTPGVNRNLSALTFQLDWLLSADGTFQFTVTVSKEDRKFTAQQILFVDTYREPHLLSANCPQCYKGLINPSVPLVIIGLCSSCPLGHANITFEWQLFHIGDVKEEKWEEEECQAGIIDDDQNNVMPTSSVRGTHKPSPRLPATQSQTTASKLAAGTKFQTPTNHPVIAQTVRPTTAQGNYVKFANGRICRDPNEILRPTSRPPVRHSRFPGSGGGSGSGANGGFGHGAGSSRGSGRGSGSGAAQGSGSGTKRGSGSGSEVVPDYGAGHRNRSKVSTTTSQQNFTTVAPVTDDDDKDKGDDGNEDDPDFGGGARNRSKVSTTTSQQNFTTLAPVTNNDVKGEPPDLTSPMYVPPSAVHSSSIITLKRREMRLPERQTTTGIKSQNLVLLGKFLKGGHTYMVSFRVFDANTGQKGKATVYFNTSDIPECGVCTVTPTVGVALETMFQLTCSKWTAVGRGPLSYHISYSIDDDIEKENILIYSGYKSAVPFALPPGLASSKHTVRIYVTVASGEGTKQRLQPLKVKVSPQTAAEGVTMEEVLFNETVGKYLTVLQEAGNDQGIRQFITALATTLNRLGSVKNVSSKFHLRTLIREKLLLVIRNLTVNDKNSAFQTSLALQTLTTRPEELDERSVQTASGILQQLGEVMQATQRRMRSKRIDDRFLLSQEFIQTMTRVTSNLIEAASILIQRDARMPFVRQKSEDNVLLRATEAAEKLIKAKLSVRVLGEQPLVITTPYIRVNATQLTSIGNSLFSLGDINFHLPMNLETQLNTPSVGKEGSCYGAMMTVYKENPFFSEMHHTKVGSLSISNCEGEDIEVRNLSSRIRISIPNESHKGEWRAEQFVLDWNHDNIHEINRTEKMVNQALHIHLEVLSKLPPGFVFKLIVSMSKTSSENDIEYLVTSSRKAVDLYLGHQKLNASGVVFARVVLEDTAYYRIKSIKKGPRISYSLSVHWMGCFYWNKDSKDWTSDGCEVMDESTDKILLCRCNHLTAFSGAFEYPPNSLTIQDLRDDEKLKEAPVTMALVISILVMYFVLLGFCVRADRHDKRKLGAIYISENITGGVSQRFQITVQTGHWFGAGTTSNVFLILHGDDCVSDPIELKSTAGKPLFERSSCDVFVLSLPGKSFGNIWKIHVWHDNSGEQPSWFLEHVIVKNVNNGLKWFFNCNRWLAVDEADGKVECELQEKSGHTSSLKECFSQVSSKSILDYHLWFSLFGRPSYSRFSRAQRLTCCVSLLLSFLCVNIAWYRPKTEVPEVLGIIDVTAESIWLGILCSIIALPVNLLWVFLFRYSRRSFRHHVKVYPISEPSRTETTELASSSVLDQSLETVLILKNIGERKRWFQTVWELDDVRSDTSSCHSMESLGHASDSTSLGYNSGQGALSCTDPPLRNSHTGLLQTCDFLADISPGRKKSLDFEKRSTYSVSMSSSASEGRGAYRSRFSLPHVCVYVAWFGCVMTACIASVFTVWYGVSFGWDMSVRWLQSLCFSLLESFLVSQPIMVVVFILYMAYKSNIKKEDEEADEGFEDLSSSALHEIHYGHINQGYEEESRKDIANVNPALALRQRQRYLKFLKPPSKSELSEARNKCAQRKALWNYAMELLVFILFLVVTCLLVASVMSPDVYRLNHSIRKAFIRSEDSQPGSIEDAWKDISAVLHDNNGSSSYTPYTTLLRDSQSLMFGRTRITQYKTGMSTTCDKDSGRGNETVCHVQCHAKGGAWVSLELNQTSDESSKQLKEIKDSHWINECTREITVEFAVYTPFLRAISAATLTVKASSTGKPKSHMELKTFPAFYESTEHGYFFRVCKLLFVILFLYHLQHEFFLALKMSKKYFTSFWRLTQLLTVAISSLCVVMYIHWSVCLYALLREVETAAQTQVFYYAKLVSLSQETLLASYSLILFLLIIRCLYLLRPFRGVVRLGKYLASLAHPLLACTVVIATFLMAFVHTGYLLFGRLHSAFKSFGDTFLLVSSFFRLEGVNHYQGPMVEEHPVLVLLYFACFLIGFYVYMRGTTAAVFVCGIPRSNKRRNKLLADFMEDFIRSKLQSLKEKTQRRERRDSTSDEEEDESDDEEVEVDEDVAPFPMEHVLDEVEDQLQELSLRMDTLMGSEVFDDRYSSDDLLSFSDRDEDVEYLYQAEQASPVSSTGYDSDHSNTSAAKWQFSSSSSHDLSDYYGKYQPGRELRDPSDWYGKYRPDTGHQASARPVKFTLGGRELRRLGLGSSSSHGMAVFPDEDAMKLDDPSCSSCYDMGRSNAGFTFYGEEGLVHGSGNRQSLALRDDGLRDGELRGGVLRDGVWHVGGLRDGILRDQGSSDGACSQDLSSCSSHSLVKRPDPDKEPIRLKTMYGVTRTHARRGHEASALRPTTAADGSSTDAVANSSSDQEMGKKIKKSHPRRSKGLFRSAAVYPGHEGFALGPSPPLGESRVQAAWGLAPSAFERGFLRTPDSHAKPSSSERGLARSPDSLVAEDSEFNSPAWGLSLPTSPDPHVPDPPVKGLVGDISMNRKLGTEIVNDDSPESATPGDEYI